MSAEYLGFLPVGGDPELMGWGSSPYFKAQVKRARASIFIVKRVAVMQDKRILRLNGQRLACVCAPKRLTLSGKKTIVKHVINRLVKVVD